MKQRKKVARLMLRQKLFEELSPSEKRGKKKPGSIKKSA
jgi:hypothetical protein